ncbi:MAG: type VI secretion system lipoprotein TssJ [Hyphomicrobiales bacterium]|nr:type VI secretion system lipoprotein TssJ [Hyphomicrobiales bacterium]MBV8663155.1 type VI secretion system lipoprotein TssJ [Hyphomicrobiales bacterium]
MRSPSGLYGVLSRRTVVGSLAFLLLQGCGGGDKGPRTTGLRFIVSADDLVNPNAESQPSPLVLRIYELKSLTAFEQASFFQLLDNDTAALGADMVAKREIEIKPGERQGFDRSTPVDTHYIGVIAGFREMENAVWRANLEIMPEQSGLIVVKVTAQAVSIAWTKDRTLGLF